MVEQGIGEGPAFLSARPGDEIEHQRAGPVARILHHRVLDDASALVAPGGKGAFVEHRRDHQQAQPVRKRARVIAICASGAGDAVKDEQQRRIGTSRRAVGENHHGRAVDVDHLSSGRNRRRQHRRAAEQTA